MPVQNHCETASFPRLDLWPYGQWLISAIDTNTFKPGVDPSAMPLKFSSVQSFCTGCLNGCLPLSTVYKGWGGGKLKGSERHEEDENSLEYGGKEPYLTQLIFSFLFTVYSYFPSGAEHSFNLHCASCIWKEDSHVIGLYWNGILALNSLSFVLKTTFILRFNEILYQL